ncbi:MAG: tricorn protease, partial [Candidatus Eremiobacteraeota bacterium]|nr:tricorn protease [Candidatus Eremiobacteraeota bacterium]
MTGRATAPHEYGGSRPPAANPPRMLVRRLLTAAALVACVVSGLPVTTNAADVVTAVAHSFAEPSLSPDHGEIAFVSGGAVWSVPSGGGTARLLAAVGGAAKRPLFSPDGKHLAFVSTQQGSSGIYVLTLDGGALRRLTHDDTVPDLSAWSADGRSVYFSSASHDLAYDADIYRVSVDGGTPMQIVHESYVNETSAAPSPDGASLAYVRGGFTQWWRRGHSHMDQTEIVIAHPAAKRFDTVTNGDAKDQWPMWSPDGRTLYFVSDRSGSDELWARGADGRARQLTSLKGGRVLWPSIARDGHLIAFERAMRIWTYDVDSGTARELSIAPRGLPDVLTQRHVTQTNRFSALALSPDGKKIAFTGRGRVFAASAQEGGEAHLVTTHGDAAYDLPVWAAGSRRIAYVVDRGTEQAIATYDFPDGPQRIVTPAGHHDDYPHWSPDGKSLAFVRDGRELHLLDVASRADRVIAHGVMDRRPFGDLGDIAFSPAGDWIAYANGERNGFTNLYVVRTSGGEPRAVTFVPNANGGPLAWSPDGTRLFYVTAQRTENGTIAQIDLIPRTPRFREDVFRKLFPDEPARPELPSRTIPTPVPGRSPRPLVTPSPSSSPSTPVSPDAPASSDAPALPGDGATRTAPASGPRRTQIDFTNIRERVTFVQTGLDVTRVAVTPDSKTLVLVANAANQENLYAFSIDETSDESQVAKQLTSTPGRKTDIAIAPDGKSAFYLDAGRAFTADLSGKGAKLLALAAELDIDFAHDKRVVFDQAWSMLDRWYADPNFHGANWGALRREYEPYALGARTPQEFYRVMSLLIGELNSSHTGISAQRPPGVPRYTTGRLGIDWDTDAYDRTGRLRVAAVVPLSPAAVAGHVTAGDELLAVDGTPADRTTDVDELLANRIGKRTTLRIAPHGD